MKYGNALSLVAQEFGKAGIPFVLIGGFAVNYYKVTRVTTDIDFLIDKQDYPKAFSLLQTFGFKEALVQSMFARLKSNDFGLLVDLVFVDKETLTGVINDGIQAEIGGDKVIVPSLNHLIALKLHAMKNNPKRIEHPDFMDVIHLIQANRLDVRLEEFKDLCLSYGTKDLYEKLAESIAKGKQ
ncbi:MAG: nucleotidyltransferase [Candidatus Omnitrophica bacterium]|nr:nucleotidyltransferase [Candidatus Omnitrophota bacterium]